MQQLRTLLIQRRRHYEPNLLSEFEALAATANYNVIGTFDIVGRPKGRFGISTGKVEEIKTWIELNRPDIVLFSPTLKSSQLFRLMEEWELEVRDRTQLILEIFEKHARTPQAKLQIEKARLNYELPFQRHQLRIRLQAEHTGDRPTAHQVGIGEDLLTKKLSELRKRIALINDKLDKISDVQSLKKKKRQAEGFTEIALAGYTNAGKSTLHRTLTGSQVEVADQLFTTLSTKTAEISMKGREAVLSDSVGFISNLPTSLLEAFNTTLMEITDADLVLLVVDGSDHPSEMRRKIQTCLTTFTEIGANGIPVIGVLNKIDLLADYNIREQLEIMEEMIGPAVPVSARTGENVGELTQIIEDALPSLQRYRLNLPYGSESMSIVSWLFESGHVAEREFNEHSIRVEAELTKEKAQQLMNRLDDQSIHEVDDE
ncbi:GTPase HflX [Candidatus Thorarchaeota archaeon]|nr:MAG: GTPase HflX [Candidatus Thorarchaeota archaeon]